MRYPIEQRQNSAAVRGRLHRRGFTLVELLVVITIIGILSSMMLFALYGASEEAKAQKTKSMIVKLNNLVMPRYEAYRTRRVPIMPQFTVINGQQQINVTGTAKLRLDALHELQRFELPECWQDIIDTPQLVPRPAVSQAYFRAYNAVMSGASPPATPLVNQNQNAETLYLIVTLGTVDELGGRELFNESNIADTDGDGFKEFIDPWGSPIRFLRWAPGFPSELNQIGSGTISAASSSSVTAGNFAQLAQTDDAYKGYALLVTSGAAAGQVAQITGYSHSSGQFTLSTSPGLSATPSAGDQFNVVDSDPFDPRHVYPMTGQTQPTFALYPLVYSAGPDKVFSIVSEAGLSNGGSPTGGPFQATVNPFYSIGNASYALGAVGTTVDISGESGTSGWSAGMKGWLDNIHSHMIGTK